MGDPSPFVAPVAMTSDFVRFAEPLARFLREEYQQVCVRMSVCVCVFANLSRPLVARFLQV